MTALAADRSAPESAGTHRQGLCGADTIVYMGAMVARIVATGYLTEGAAGTGLIGVGVATERATNTGGSAGDVAVKYQEGVFRFGNSSSGDAIAATDVGKVCYIADDQTVAKTSGDGARSPAGFVVAVSSAGVDVEMDESKLRAWLLARKKVVPLRCTTVAGSGSPVYRVVSPYTGRITQIESIIELALTTGNATLTAGIGSTAITGGVLTLTQSGSAAGDIDTATPTAENYVAAGDELRITVTGTQAAAAAANVNFHIDAE